MTDFRPRPGQREVLAYTGGRMGVSAVPGSGKTRTLAELAARLVRLAVGSEQEVLVVTLVNSAVDNFKSRINESVRELGLLPNFGYRVRTLHGLAHDIVRERPGLVGLSEDFGIIDEREARAIGEEAVEAWLRAHPEAADLYLDRDLEGSKADWVRRDRWPALARDVTIAFIKRAKDLQLTPTILLERLAGRQRTLEPGKPGSQIHSLPLAQMAAEIYGDYQRSLAYRGVVDFDDLIRLALEALRQDEDYLARLQHRWPYVLEDEAQDSSELQEQILRLLVGETGNWVRVGDPNQAIYDTFTNADPHFLRTYLEEPDVTRVELTESGRSQPAIIDLANYLVDWTSSDHPIKASRGALLKQHIQPTDAGDPQPNPPGNAAAVQINHTAFTPERELQAVISSLESWVPDHPTETAAVLAPRNRRGEELVPLLKDKGIPCIELLRSTSITRQTAGALGNLLHCLANPQSARRLATAFEVWRRENREAPEANNQTKVITKRIRSCPAVESYLWPRADHDWLEPLTAILPAEQLTLLLEFRGTARRWHRAASLPIDQLILTLANDLFREPAELALAHKLAALLRDIANAHPGYRLPELVEELAVIARNERRFLGFASEDGGFDPPPGSVTIATMHKAKGLEWDSVYLMSVNNYDFPSGMAHDSYIAERWFIRDNLNLEAEALAQLEELALPPDSPGRKAKEETSIAYVEGEPTQQARIDYVAERLRLLYVGITRAKRELTITWNTGRHGREKLQQAVPFIALHDHWQQKK